MPAPTSARLLFSLVLAAATATAQAPAEDCLRLARCCNAFAADLVAKLPENARTCSPASISIALLMLLPGARGLTAAEIANVLHLPVDLRDERLSTAASQLLEQSGVVAGRNQARSEPAALYLANDLWVQKGHALVDSYVALLHGSFGADRRSVDFAAAPDAARQTINAHVAEATHDRIRDLIPPGLLDESTRVVLTNALWFKAAWEHPFSKAATQDAAFHLADGTSADVPMMRIAESFQYAEAADWQFLSMPFAAAHICFEAMLPCAGQSLASAEHTLLTRGHEQAIGWQQVRVSLPRFRVAAGHFLREPLIALGMHDAFAPGAADFSAMDPQKQLVVDDLVHRTWIDVDENGAEAAAATAMVLKAGAAAPRGEPKLFVADRPFAFVLRDTRTGLVLFAGRVDDPRATKQAGG
ncbi:MAG TPA: serpin family protein [Planctomycetota bacterium]|nr:serpin family protein [Planctomycetota bacterium]